MKRLLVVVAVLLFVAIGVWLWAWACGGVSSRELRSAVEDESAAIQTRVDERFAVLDAKLDRIEAKIDRLIEMATPKLPDGMRVAQ